MASALVRDSSHFDAHPHIRQAVTAEETASVRALPRPLPRPQTRAGARASATPRLSANGAMVFVCVMALMLFIVYAYTQMAEMGNASQRLSREISQLQQEETALLRQKNDMIDLQEIERIAVDRLGMVKPSINQIVYINLSGQDHAEVIKPGGSGLGVREADPP